MTSGIAGKALDTWRRQSLGIKVGVWWNVALLAGSLAASPFDPRRILGLNPWIKPIKFEISVIVYLVTVGLLLGVLEASGRRAKVLRLMGWGFAVSMIVENTIIALQSGRGVRSHMNYTSAFNGLAFGAMGIFILVNTLLLAVLLGLFCVGTVTRPRAERWGIRAGLAMILAGSLEGVRMVAGGGHTVGADDGGAGLPLVNWSTLHGDLRVAHFFALHALQLLWLAGWLIGRSGLPPRTGAWATAVISAAYAGVVWMLFAEAMAGRPLLALR